MDDISVLKVEKVSVAVKPVREVSALLIRSELNSKNRFDCTTVNFELIKQW